jgi:hypothetical protein
LQNEPNFLEWNQHLTTPVLSAPAVTGAQPRGTGWGRSACRYFGGGIERRRHPLVEAAAAPYRARDDALERAIVAEDHDIDLALDDVEGLALGSNPSGLLHWASGEDHVEG